LNSVYFLLSLKHFVLNFANKGFKNSGLGCMVEIFKGGGQKAEFNMRLLRPTEAERGSLGQIEIWALRLKFCWELNLTN